MKKKLSLLLMSMFIIGSIFAFVNFTSVQLNALVSPYDPPEAGGGGTTYYDRHDTDCPRRATDPIRQKTTCTKGGDQLCSPRYCN